MTVAGVSANVKSGRLPLFTFSRRCGLYLSPQRFSSQVDPVKEDHCCGCNRSCASLS